ncbi:protein of unknown function [Candidatus Nitrospira inopinata]|jgi:hypothetical protein|uniref:Uncharacterized protein n=1 Tax=Candidatus Nitrospira inopinata TaxID=1715989 RepID=A0A0S4KPP6_9BACT|nr:protein of unknown function [Candidatus Nitrospira inopinata]
MEDRGATVAAIQHMIDVSTHLPAKHPRQSRSPALHTEAMTEAVRKETRPKVEKAVRNTDSAQKGLDEPERSDNNPVYMVLTDRVRTED